MNDPFQDVDKAGIEFAENTAQTMEIRQSEPIMEKIVQDYLTELEFVSEKPTIEIGCGPGAISRRIAKHASRTHRIIQPSPANANRAQVPEAGTKTYPALCEFSLSRPF